MYSTLHGALRMQLGEPWMCDIQGLRDYLRVKDMERIMTVLHTVPLCVQT